MRRGLHIMLVFATNAVAQTYYVAEHRTAGVYTGSVPAEIARIDLSNRKSDDVRQWRGPVPTEYPALVDAETRLWVPLTGTVAQAQARLGLLLTNTRPAAVRERGKNKKGELSAAKGGGNSTAALRASINRLAELFEELDERVSALEREQ